MNFVSHQIYSLAHQTVKIVLHPFCFHIDELSKIRRAKSVLDATVEETRLLALAETTWNETKVQEIVQDWMC